MERIVWISSALSCGLLAGAFLLASSALRRVVDGLDTTTHIEMRQRLIPRFRTVLLPMMLLAVLTTSLAAVFATSQRPSFAWLAAGLAALAPVLTIICNVPVNRRVLTWDPATPPQRWKDDIASWNRADTVRLGLSVGALVCALAAR